VRTLLGRRLALVAVRVYQLADWVAGADTLAAYQQELERERLLTGAAA
jgi:hypothetical protein